MPARQINFLAERRKSLTKTEQQDMKFLRVMGIIFGTVVVLCVVILAIRFYLASQFTQVQAGQKAARSQIVDNESIERSFVVFVYKLTALANLTQDKEEKNEAITFFTNLFGPDILIKKMSFLEAEKILSLRIQSDSIFSLREVFTKLNDEAVSSQFASLNASDLARAADGNYEMSITAVIKPKASVSGQLQPSIQFTPETATPQ